MHRSSAKFAAPSWVRVAAGCVPLAVVVGLMTPSPAAQAASRSQHVAPPHVAQAKPGDFGPTAARSRDIASNGWGDPAGYHVDVGRAAAGFIWHEVAVLDPAGYDEASWTG
jgi:hypothetical protein